MNRAVLDRTHTRFRNSKLSLRTHLIIWIGLLALLPLTLISWLSYQQARESLSEAAENELRNASLVKSRSVTDWYQYRLVDLTIHSESKNTRELLNSLIDGYQSVGMGAGDYVKSPDWINRIGEKQTDLITLNNRYDYIYDTFLIDQQGNILYTVAEESDLGTNLLDGPFSNTAFGETVRHTLETGETWFSGLERYGPSADAFASFLATPVFNSDGQRIGVFAVQLRFDIKHSTSLPEIAKKRLIKLAGRRITEKGILVIKAERYRSQAQNRQDAIDRLVSMIVKALKEPKK